MAVPVFEVSSFELTMMASQVASADLANFSFVLFPCDSIVNSRDKSSNTG